VPATNGAAAVTRSVFSPAYLPPRTWLVEARQARGLTQVQLALDLGRPQSFVSKYERGERRLDFVEVLEVAAVLQADLCVLVTELSRRRKGGGPSGRPNQIASRHDVVIVAITPR